MLAGVESNLRNDQAVAGKATYIRRGPRVMVARYVMATR